MAPRSKKAVNEEEPVKMDVEEVEEVEEVTEEEEEEDNSGEEMDEDSDVVADADKISIVGSHGDATAMTFCFKEEDHTLGNSLRHVINKNPNVDFCGYSIPHPSVNEMNIRIQTTDKTTAVDALKTGLSNLYDIVAHIRQAYVDDLAKKEYVEFEEIA